MQYSTALSDALLALACMACVVLLGRQRANTPEAQRPRLFCMQLGFALPMAAAMAGSVRYGLAPDWSELHDWLSRASSFLGLPLLGFAALTLARKWQWSGPAWGRLLIGLCAFFELFRQLSWLDEYRQFVQLGSLLLIAYGGLLQWPQRLSVLLAATVIGLFAVAGLVVGSDGFIGSLRRVDLFHALLSCAYPLLAWLLIRMMQARKTGKDFVTGAQLHP